jgi:hypothetical protein
MNNNNFIQTFQDRINNVDYSYYMRSGRKKSSVKHFYRSNPVFTTGMMEMLLGKGHRYSSKNNEYIPLRYLTPLEESDKMLDTLLSKKTGTTASGIEIFYNKIFASSILYSPRNAQYFLSSENGSNPINIPYTVTENVNNATLLDITSQLSKAADDLIYAFFEESHFQTHSFLSLSTPGAVFNNNFFTITKNYLGISFPFMGEIVNYTKQIVPLAVIGVKTQSLNALYIAKRKLLPSDLTLLIDPRVFSLEQYFTSAQLKLFLPKFNLFLRGIIVRAKDHYDIEVKIVNIEEKCYENFKNLKKVKTQRDFLNFEEDEVSFLLKTLTYE